MPKKLTETLFLADVVPLVPLPGGRRDSYSYLSETAIPFGSVVRIPFGPRAIRGIVVRCEAIAAETLPARLKRVTGIIAASFLTEHQLMLARHISETCFTSLGRTLNHFLPKAVAERTKKTENKEPKKRFVPTTPERDIIGAIMNSAKKHLIAEADAETMFHVTLGVHKKRKATEQILILFPELIALPDAHAFFRERIPAASLAMLHSKLSDGAFFSAWERIRSGEATIVIGTRQALFAPFRNLAAIFILDEEEAIGYKQWDMSPRYDARSVAIALADLHGAKTVSASPTPSLETTVHIRKKRLVPVTKPLPEAKEPFTFVDMRQERYKKNYSIFSEALTAEIRWMNRQGKQSLLIGSRSGIDSFSVCTECKTVPHCPTDDRALRSTREGNFRCPVCTYRTATFPRCAKCGSLSFRSVGSGTEKIEREARKLFPGMKVVRVGEKAYSVANFEAETLAVKDADIVIGTASILHLPILPTAGFIAIMDADNFLSFPDFRADEKFLGILAHGFLTATRHWAYGKVFIQAFAPEKKPFSSIRDHGMTKVRETILTDREALGYPPFTAAWKLTVQDASKEKSLTEAGKQQEAFLAIADTLKGVRVSPVNAPLVPLVRGKYRHHFIIRLPDSDPLPDPLRKAITALPSSWMVEPDPLTLN